MGRKQEERDRQVREAHENNVADTADTAEAFGADLSILPQHAQDAVRNSRAARDRRKGNG
jgi:hypothetical protein